MKDEGNRAAINKDAAERKNEFANDAESRAKMATGLLATSRVATK